MNDRIRNTLVTEIGRVEAEIGPHQDIAAFLTVLDALRNTEGSDAARAYHGGSLVTLYSDEGNQYTIGFDSLLEELLTLAAREVGRELTDEDASRPRDGVL